jgi:hypothetical protein
MHRTTNIKELTDAMVFKEAENQVFEPKKQDFRKPKVLYCCTAVGGVELCKRYSPGPSGNCSHQLEIPQACLCLCLALDKVKVKEEGEGV